MLKGESVKVRLYGGKTATRRVVAIKRDIVVICAEEEYLAAQREHREPQGLGFPKSDIIDAPRERKVAIFHNGEGDVRNLENQL